VDENQALLELYGKVAANPELAKALGLDVRDAPEGGGSPLALESGDGSDPYVGED